MVAAIQVESVGRVQGGWGSSEVGGVCCAGGVGVWWASGHVAVGWCGFGVPHTNSAQIKYS